MKTNLLKFAMSLAEGAGEILEKKFLKVKTINKKYQAGIVTEADSLAESYIIRRIQKEFPTSSILSEEIGDIKKKDEMKWIIDPLDGTTNFAHGFPWFNVSIGVEEYGEVTTGVVYHPLMKDMFIAEKKKGAFHLNPKRKYRMFVSKTKKLENALIATGFYYMTGQELSEEIKRFENLQLNARGVRRAGAAALDLAYVAAGRFDGFWEKNLSPWDLAAGYILITEAGGKLSTYMDEPFSIYGTQTVASNKLIHSQILKSIRLS